MSKWTWSEFWGLRSRIPTDYRDRLDKELGISIPTPNHILIDEQLRAYLESCSVKELEQVLAGAPFELTAVFIHLLPVPSVKKIMKCYRMSEAKRLALAYQHPPLLKGPE